MKKFVIMTIGFTKPTPELMQEWQQWFKSINDKIVDQVGLSNGKTITKDGLSDLPFDLDTITGFVIINAENMDEALEIARDCPMVTATKVYEVRSS